METSNNNSPDSPGRDGPGELSALDGSSVQLEVQVTHVVAVMFGCNPKTKGCVLCGVEKTGSVTSALVYRDIIDQSTVGIRYAARLVFSVCLSLPFGDGLIKRCL